MQFTCSLLLGLGLIAGTQADAADDWKYLNFIFNSGPNSHQLFILRDIFHDYPTYNNDSIDTIDVYTPNYDAINRCMFNITGPNTLTSSVTPDLLQHILVSPPQPVLNVRCL
ncbi:hypothetical protein GGS21DRAFT_131151 [Xylaria nigripes]|nr:hypothetical protein GGS21DRAFT_131151 [Xylaria nigripes]